MFIGGLWEAEGLAGGLDWRGQWKRDGPGDGEMERRGGG